MAETVHLYLKLNGADIQGAAGFQGDAIALIAEALQQGDAGSLGQGLATGDAYVLRTEGADLLENGIHRGPIADVKRIRRVAVLTSKRTAGESDEHGRVTDRIRFALQRMEDLVDAQTFQTVRARLAGQCFSLDILSRRCFASRPALASGYCSATCESISRALPHCLSS